ncbi:hypothetical protein ACFJIX_21125 [Roseateles sp. UC29_93]|uniref:hypothetical protein n=1 Tax=Roseateles sp. UC29_93 TaxID=3350177 RepID=UPI00366A9983
MLDVVPIEGEYGTSYLYLFTRDAITVELGVYPLAGDVSLRIVHGQQDEPVLNLQLLGCPAARVIRDKQGTCIEFAAANVFTGRFDETTAAPYGFRLRIRPLLQVEPYSYPV